MLHPMPREIYYSGDVSKPPKAGDKSIELDWDESSLSLDVSHGILPDQNSRNPTRRFPTLDKLHEEIGKLRKHASSRGFKRYKISYVEAEGEPLKDVQEATKPAPKRDEGDD
jgi:hypothetical protein